jgi:prohibitin 2
MDSMWTVGRIAKYVFGLFLVIFVLSNLPFTTVGAGERGVVTNYGKVSENVLGEGFHFINPFGIDVHKMDVKVQKTEVDANAASKDLQTVTAKIAVTYRLNEADVIKVFRDVRQNYADRYINPNIQEAVKAATAKYTAEELITKREAVKGDIIASFSERLTGTGVVLEQLNIINFDFSADFNRAIERKVTAEQDAKTAQNKLVQVQAEAQQSVEKAKAEAESIRLQGAAANSDKYIQLKQLEVELARAKKWNGVLPVNIYGSAPIPFLNVK